MKEKVKQLMFDAIEHPRPEIIKPYLLSVWNQPFFYKIDQAQALTVSYNPTDKGARTNYPEMIEEYKRNGRIETDRIYNTLYNFKKEEYWRRNYDIIFSELGINIDNIAHMDVSFFPYSTLDLCKEYSPVDDTKKYLLSCIDILKEQLKYIFVDGKRNRDIIYLLCKDYKLYKATKMPVNGSNREYELLIFKHNNLNTYLIYYGCFLYGATTPKKECVLEIARYIRDSIQEY